MYCRIGQHLPSFISHRLCFFGGDRATPVEYAPGLRGSQSGARARAELAPVTAQKATSRGRPPSHWSANPSLKQAHAKWRGPGQRPACAPPCSGWRRSGSWLRSRALCAATLQQGLHPQPGANSRPQRHRDRVAGGRGAPGMRLASLRPPPPGF